MSVILRMATINHEPRTTTYKLQTTHWKIEGMSCSNCALTIGKYLEKEGMHNVKISLVSGDLSFDSPHEIDWQSLRKGIRGLGYSVVDETAPEAPLKKRLNRHLRYVLICLPFTVILLLHMAGDSFSV